ncbi:MAG: hypothetical protein WAW06_08950 [bacterium]
MNPRSRILAAAGLIAVVLVAGRATPTHAARRVGLEAGHLHSSSGWYGSGLVYGATIIEGTGNFGTGLTMMRAATSEASRTVTKTGIFRHTDDYSDFCVTLLGTWTRADSTHKTLYWAGLGPQVHIISATRQHTDEGFAESARESRFGIGLLGRCERKIEAFGSVAVALSVACSWMESGIDTSADPYAPFAPPAGAVSSVAVTAGLSLPF